MKTVIFEKSLAMFQVTTCHDLAVSVQQSSESVTVTCGADSAENALHFGISPEFPVSREDYVFFPACCYDGNRFDVLKKEYPPLFSPDEARTDMPVTITDVPRLEKGGSGRIDVTTGDLSVPCVGIWSRSLKRAFFLFTVQQIAGKNLGLTYEDGRIMVSWPAMREKAYVWPHVRQSPDKPAVFRAGETISLCYHVIETDCAELPAFFRIFFENRKRMGLDSGYPEALSFSEQAAIQIEKFNQMNWCEPGGFYGVGTDRNSPRQIWQPGWVGGGMSSYALMKIGGPLEWERGLKTLKLYCIVCSANFIALAEYPLLCPALEILLPHRKPSLSGFQHFPNSPENSQKSSQKHILFPKSIFRLKFGKLKSPENAVISALFSQNPISQKRRLRKAPCLCVQFVFQFFAIFVIVQTA